MNTANFSFIQPADCKVPTTWGPLVTAGPQIKAQKLEIENKNTLVIKASDELIKERKTSNNHAKIFAIAASVIFFIYAIYGSSETIISDFILLCLFLGLFLIVFHYQYSRAQNIRKTFDLITGEYCCNYKDTSNYVYNAQLSEIYALQIIKEQVKIKRRKSSHYYTYNSYELNMILKDGRRVNLMDHNKKEHLYNDAKTLAQFLKIPAIKDDRVYESIRETDTNSPH